MKKIFLVYGHYNDNSFNAAIRDEFVKQSKVNGNQVDVVDLYKEKFDPVFAGEEPDQEVLDHRKRIEESDTIVLIAPIWNFRMPAIVEGWIDKVLAPPWAFRFKQLVGNYGYPIGNLRDKKAIIFCTYGSPRLAITTFFLNLPIRRLKRGVFHMCGIYNIVYRRYFAVPFVSDAKRQEFLNDVSGIEQTWKFAHPNNKRVTGPLSNFKMMIKSDSYGMMINHLSHTITELGSSDKWAQFEVIILDKDKIYHKFNWQVEKYTSEGILKDCWLTTMVSSPIPLGSSI